ncbi:hypothetical protein, partial [Escherichia coli]|uniref:hypothetical protein n=1 Tax=Escherichia coli TaxID=562 RepID=UPI0012FF98FE
SLKTSIKTITYLSDIGCLEIQGASLPTSQRSKLPRYVVKLHEDDFFDEEDAEVLRFDSFDDAVECCADLNIPFFVDTGNKKLVFWFVRV